MIWNRVLKSPTNVEHQNSQYQNEKKVQIWKIQNLMDIKPFFSVLKEKYQAFA